MRIDIWFYFDEFFTAARLWKRLMNSHHSHSIEFHSLIFYTFLNGLWRHEDGDDE